MPQSPVFTWSTSAESRTKACRLVLRYHGFTAYQCVRADVGSLNQHPSINHSLRLTAPTSLLVTWLSDDGVGEGVTKYDDALMCQCDVVSEFTCNSQNITTHNKICINVVLVRCVYSMLSAVIHFQEKLELGRLICCICCSLLVVIIPWRSLRLRRNTSSLKNKEINKKLRVRSISATTGHMLPNGLKKHFFLFFYCCNASEILNSAIKLDFSTQARL